MAVNKAAGPPGLGGRARSDVLGAGALGVGFAVEGDFLAFLQGIERHRLALAAVKEHFMAVAGGDAVQCLLHDVGEGSRRIEIGSEGRASGTRPRGDA